MAGAATSSTASRAIGSLAGPRGWPLVGHLLQFDMPRLHLQMEAWARDFGPLYRIRIGRRDVLVLSDPDAIAVALRARPDTWRRLSSFEPILREMGGHGVFSAEGDDWRRQRRLVMSAFDPAHLRRFMPSLLRVAERLLRRWVGAAQAGARMDLQAELMRFSVDVTAGLAFGVDMNTVEQERSELHEHLEKVFPMIHRRMNLPLAYWRYVKLPVDRAFDRDVQAIRAAGHELLAQAHQRLRDQPDRVLAPTDLLEAMLVARDADGSALSEEEILGNVLTILVAGEDTTANSLAWALYLLGRHPAAWDRVVAEADTVLGAATLPASVEQVRTLPYAEACVNEAMRLHPVAPLLFLDALRETRVLDVQVPAGTTLFCAMRPGAVDAARIEQAGGFVPERWLGGDATLAAASPKRVSMPFGAGPRLCPGRTLAMLEMNLVLALVARNFELLEVGTDQGTPPAERMAFTMFPLGLRLRLGLRDGAQSVRAGVH
ncbi:MAG TPA: cytochrome P450 [Rubrivivax sp.]